MKEDIYVLAHEMKNPLCVVKGYLEMLNKNNLEKYKKILKEEINTSIDILDNYLEYNKLSLNIEEIDINMFLSDIKNSMYDYLFKKGVKLKINYIDDEIYLKVDYNKLKNVFYNIIKNSVEAQSKNIVINYKIFYNELKITIKDDGLLCNSIDKIGNNFSDKVLGNGIGMTISKKIIMMHGGKIKFQNEKNGVNVIITLTLS